MTKIKKAIQVKLLDYAKDVLTKAGFVFDSSERNWHSYSIETKSGRLGVTVKVDHYGVDFFARYDDVSKARKNKIPCNPYTGKYNFHCLISEEKIKYVIDLYVNS
ncbi:hypothetical protein KAR91_32255 [Candidatus Pacearchaeota archaeon]|nr:hypothetical protein [Candidatus Pacearchaeota archaeon]